MVLSPEPIKRATVVESKVLGVLDMEDEGAKDYKVIAVPQLLFAQIFRNKDLEDSFLQISKNFFAHYKDLSSSGPKVKVLNWHDKSLAFDIINQSIKNLEEARKE